MALKNFALSLLFAFAAMSTSSASEKPQAPDTLIFNISTDGYPPFTIVHEDGQIGGIFWDVLNTIATRHSIKLEAIQLPTRRVDQFLLEGRADVTMRAIEWTNEPHRFVFSEPLLLTRDAIFFHRNQRQDIRSVDELKGLLLLTQLGFKYPELDEALHGGEIEHLEIQDQQSMFRRLREGTRFHAAVSNLHAGQWVLRANQWQEEIALASIEFESVPYRLMFAPKHQAFVETVINQELEAMRASGELDRIRNLYR